MSYGNMGTIWSEMAFDYSGLSRGMSEAFREIRNFDQQTTGAFRGMAGNVGKYLTDIGRSLTVSVTVPLTALGTVAARASSDFETAMANVWTITDITKRELQSYGAEIEAMSQRVPQSAKQLADGLYDAISSGIRDTGEAIGVVEIAAKAAMAGMSDTATAVDALTSVLNAYGMAANEAGNITDIMFRTVDRGKVTFGELAGSIGRVISTAATAKVPFEEVAAAYATLTRGGVKAAEASTSINQAILSMIQPTKEAKDYANQLGIEFNATALESKGFVGVLDDIYRATGGNIEAISTLFPNIRSLKGVLGLIRNDMQDYIGDLEQMASASGATEKAFAKQMDTSAAKSQLFKNEVSALARSIGDELWPILLSIMDALKPIIQAFKELPAGIKQAAVGWGIFAAALGPVLMGLGAIVSLLQGPAGVILAISAIVAGIYGWVKASRDLDDSINRQVASARNYIDEAMRQAQAYEEQATQLDKLIREYEELQGKPDKSQSEHERLRKVIDDIVQIAPQAVTGYDDMGQALIDNADAAKMYRDELWRLHIDQLEMAAMRAEYELPLLKEQKRMLDPMLAGISKELEKLLPRQEALQKVAALIRKEIPMGNVQAIDWFNQHVRRLTGQDQLRSSSPEWFKPSKELSLALNELLKAEPLLHGTNLSYERIVELASETNSQYKSLIATMNDLGSTYFTVNAGIIELTGAQERLNAALAERPKDLDRIDLLTGAGETTADTIVKTPEIKPEPVDLTEFEEWGRKVAQLNSEVYGALQTEWAKIEEELQHEDITVRRWAEMRASTLLSVIEDAIAEFSGDWSEAAAAVSIEVESGYKTIRDKYAVSLSEFEKLGQELAAMTDESLEPLKVEWADLATILASEDTSATDYTWAEARVGALVNAIKDTLLQSAGDSDAAFAAAKKVFEDGYDTLRGAAIKGQSELAKVMATFRYNVAIGAIEGTESQTDELERIKETGDYAAASLEERRQLEVQLAQLKENLRQEGIRSAYEEYQFQAQLLGYTAADHVAHLNRLSADETLNAKERQDIENSLLLWRKQQTDEDAEYKKQVNDAWNRVYLDTGRKTQADSLRQTLATRQAELEAAQETGKGIEKAEAKLAQARVDLNKQLLQDDLDRLQFQVAMGAATAEEQLDWVQKRLNAEEYGLEHWIEITEDTHNNLLLLQKQLEVEVNKSRAEQTVQAIGSLHLLKDEHISTTRERLLAELGVYQGMSEAGRDAVAVIKTALNELEALEEGRFNEAVQRGEKSLQEQIDFVDTLLARQEKGTLEYSRLETRKFELLKRQQTELANTMVDNLGDILEASQADLLDMRTSLGEALLAAEGMGVKGQNAADIYSRALSSVNDQLDRLADTQSELDLAKLRIEYESDPAKGTEAYIAELQKRLSAVVLYSREWENIRKEIARIESEETKREAEETVKALGILGEKSLEELASVKASLAERQAAYVDLGKKGEAAAKVIEDALNGAASTQRNLFNDMVRSGELTIQEQIDWVTAWINAAERGTSEYSSYLAELLRLQQQLKREEADTEIDRLIGEMPKTIDELEIARDELGKLYELTKAAGIQGADAMKAYESAIIKVNAALEKAQNDAKRLNEEVAKTEDRRQAELYKSGDLDLSEYKRYLESQLETLDVVGEKYSTRGINLASALSGVLAVEYEQAAKTGIDSLGDLQKANIATARTALETMRTTYASYVEGAKAVALIDEALQALDKRQQGFGRTMEQVGAEVAQSYEDRLQRVLTWGTDMLNEAVAQREDTAEGWTAYREQEAAILAKVTMESAKIYAEQAQEKVAQARELSKTNLLAAIESLEGWLNTTAGVGDAWVAAKEIVGDALSEMKKQSQGTAESILGYLARIGVDPLEAAITDIDKVIEEYKKSVKVGEGEDADVTPDELEQTRAFMIAKATEQALKSRIGSAQRMSEEEVAIAQVTLDIIKGIVLEKVGAESDAAELIQAVQVQLNARMLALATERAEMEAVEANRRIAHELEVERIIAELRGDEQQAFELTLEQKIASLRKAGWSEVDIVRWAVAHGESIRKQAAEAEYEMQKRFGLLSVEEQLAHELEIAESSQDSAKARIDAAVGYYSALSSLIKDAKATEVSTIKATLTAQLAQYEKAGQGASEMALAIVAALKLIEAQGDNAVKKAEEIAKGIREITNTMVELAELLGAGSEVQEGIQNLGNAVADSIRVIALYGAGDIAGAIKSSVSLFVSLGKVIDNLSPSVRATRAEFRVMADEMQRALSGLDEFGSRSVVQLSELATGYKDQLEQWQHAAEKRANAGFFTRLWWGLTGSAPDAGSEAGLAAAQAFVEAWKSVASALDSGVKSAMQSGIKAFLDGTDTIADALREGIRSAIINAITQAMIQGALIQGALGALLTQLTDELAQQQWDAARRTIEAIASEIPGIAAELEQVLQPLADALDTALPSDKVGRSGRSGTQISDITGPSRDLLIETMRPLRVLDSLPVYAMAMETAIYEMRDAFLAYASVKAATEAGMGAVRNEYHISTINIYSNGKEDFDQLMSSLGRRADMALLGSGA